jgi:hypothetical protein
MAKRRLKHSPKHRKKVMLQMENLSHCGNTSRNVMVYHSMIVIVNASHLQRKVKIIKTSIMVMIFPILYFIIKNMIM